MMKNISAKRIWMAAVAVLGISAGCSESYEFHGESPVCDVENEIWCNNVCLEKGNFDKFHWSACNKCEEGWCDSDDNLTNGCEYYFLDDTLHLASCGKCENGWCDSNENLADGCDYYYKDETLHLASCGVCAEHYYDGNNDPLDGCEIDLLTNHDNCGNDRKQCRNDQICQNGDCVCQNGMTDCNGECLDLKRLHLKDCNVCEDGYNKNNDSDARGCWMAMCGSDNPQSSQIAEFVDTQNDPNNCGQCGYTCKLVQECVNGKCQCPDGGNLMMVTGSGIVIRNAPDATAKELAKLNQYDYICGFDFDNNNTYINVRYTDTNHQDFEGWIYYESLAKTLDICEECPNYPVVEYAEQFLYKNTNLCVYDHLKKSDGVILENLMDRSVDSSGESSSCSNNSSCHKYGYKGNNINFVSACLITPGLLSKPCVDSTTLAVALPMNGWQVIDYTEAKAGDVYVGNGVSGIILGFKNEYIYIIYVGAFLSDNDPKAPCQSNPNGDTPSNYERVLYGYRNLNGISIFTHQNSPVQVINDASP